MLYISCGTRLSVKLRQVSFNLQQQIRLPLVTTKGSLQTVIKKVFVMNCMLILNKIFNIYCFVSNLSSSPDHDYYRNKFHLFI